MAVQIAAMIVSLLLVSGVALKGLDSLSRDYGAAFEGFDRLRQVYEASSHLVTAQKLLRMAHPQAIRVAAEEVAIAARNFEQIPSPPDGSDTRADADLRQSVRALADRMTAAALPGDLAGADDHRDAVTQVLSQVPRVASELRKTAESRQQAAVAKRRATLWTVGLLCGLIVFAASLLGVAQYRGVMRPLNRLRQGVRRVAAGQFHDRLSPEIERSFRAEEFAALAHDFDRMAAELEGLYRDLEQKVAAKSRELIRSERLASVGYLAAGVAHEINNPLAIISGYAEHSLSELSRRSSKSGNGAAGEPSEVERSLKVISEEAFRCKQITDQLLSLARPGEPDRRAVSLADVADHVAGIVRALNPFRDRVVEVHAIRTPAPMVHAVEAEMKQVLLNLAVNALEATSPEKGKVVIEVRSTEDGWVELSVTDNGRGMNAETLDRVFEPFFTEKRGTRESGPHGTGLGLAISHAIVQSHGGVISASSDGIDKGSRFLVRLPVADQSQK